MLFPGKMQKLCSRQLRDNLPTGKNLPPNLNTALVTTFIFVQVIICIFSLIFRSICRSKIFTFPIQVLQEYIMLLLSWWSTKSHRPNVTSTESAQFVKIYLNQMLLSASDAVISLLCAISSSFQNRLLFIPSTWHFP